MDKKLPPSLSASSQTDSGSLGGRKELAVLSTLRYSNWTPLTIHHWKDSKLLLKDHSFRGCSISQLKALLYFYPLLSSVGQSTSGKNSRTQSLQNISKWDTHHFSHTKYFLIPIYLKTTTFQVGFLHFIDFQSIGCLTLFVWFKRLSEISLKSTSSEKFKLFQTNCGSFESLYAFCLSHLCFDHSAIQIKDFHSKTRGRG
jgi:hypothetical protein